MTTSIKYHRRFHRNRWRHKSMRDVYTPTSSPVPIPTLKQEAHSTPGSLLLKGLKPSIFAKIPASEEEGSYTVSSSDEGISDGHTKIHYGDEEDSISLKAPSISPVHARSTITLYMNPVYQSSDGRVYAVRQRLNAGWQPWRGHVL